MESANLSTNKLDIAVLSSAMLPSNAAEIDALRRRSFELLSKFRTAWNESEYQEWCAIQRLLHKMI